MFAYLYQKYAHVKSVQNKHIIMRYVNDNDGFRYPKPGFRFWKCHGEIGLC